MFWLIKTAVKLILLAAVVSVPMAYARLYDSEGVRAVLLEQILGCAGRRLEVRGGGEVQAAYPPVLIIKDIRLRNASWGRAEHMLIIDRLEAEFDLLPLAAGNMAAPRVRLTGVDAVFETGAEGVSNWEALGAAAGVGQARAAGLAAVLGPLLAGSGAVTVTDGVLTVIDSASGLRAKVPFNGGDIELAAAAQKGGSGGAPRAGAGGCQD